MQGALNLFPEYVFTKGVLLEKSGYIACENILDLFPNKFWNDLYDKLPNEGVTNDVVRILSEQFFCPLLNEAEWFNTGLFYTPTDFSPFVTLRVGRYVFTITPSLFGVKSFYGSGLVSPFKYELNDIWNKKKLVYRSNYILKLNGT